MFSAQLELKAKLTRWTLKTGLKSIKVIPILAIRGGVCSRALGYQQKQQIRNAISQQGAEEIKLTSVNNEPHKLGY